MSEIAKISHFVSVFAAVCTGRPLEAGESCESPSKEKAKQIAQKYKNTLPIFTDWSKTFITSPISRVINSILNNEAINQTDINTAPQFFTNPDYKIINAQEWQNMIDHYSANG